MSAVLKRRIAFLEAQLAAREASLEKTFDVYRETLSELVEIKMRNEAALAALSGHDYFEGQS
jgi:hypothetical protein